MVEGIKGSFYKRFIIVTGFSYYGKIKIKIEWSKILRSTSHTIRNIYYPQSSNEASLNPQRHQQNSKTAQTQKKQSHIKI